MTVFLMVYGKAVYGVPFKMAPLRNEDIVFLRLNRCVMAIDASFCLSPIALYNNPVYYIYNGNKCRILGIFG